MKHLYLIIFAALFNACNIIHKTHSPPVVYNSHSQGIVSIGAKHIDSTAIERTHKKRAVQEKYARLLSVPADSINITLYSFIDDWINTPYLWGGEDKEGIDCSAFIRRLFFDVYGLKMPRTSLEQMLTHRVERFTAIKYLSEGDILFFRTIKGTIVSHVGMYLRNNRFINSSSDKGVVIYNLMDSYWKIHFVIAARVRTKESKKDLIDNVAR